MDTDNLDANFAAVLDGSTGEFRDIYAKSSVQLRQLLIDHDATGTNTESPDPRIDRSRIVMTMRNVDGEWKVENVDLP